MQSKYELKMKLLREDLELRRKVEILEIEERKNNHSKRRSAAAAGRSAVAGRSAASAALRSLQEQRVGGV